jgi:hypothetical protein
LEQLTKINLTLILKTSLFIVVQLNLLSLHNSYSWFLHSYRDQIPFCLFNFFYIRKNNLVKGSIAVRYILANSIEILPIDTYF